MMKLSSKQLQTLTDLAQTRKANDTTLRTALDHHIQCESNCVKIEQELWGELAEIHGLNLTNSQYAIRLVDDVPQIVEVGEVQSA